MALGQPLTYLASSSIREDGLRRTPIPIVSSVPRNHGYRCAQTILQDYRIALGPRAGQKVLKLANHFAPT